MKAAQRRTLITLMGAQGAGGIGVTIGIAAAALLAKELTGSVALSGLAQTTQVLGSAIAAFWLARMMGRYGRRPGLAVGYIVGGAGALVCGLSAVVGSFVVLLVGSALLGASTAANGQSRYAAVDLSRPERRSRSLAVVVWATTIGAVTGPSLTGPASRIADAVGIATLAGPFLAGAVGLVIAGGVVAVFLRPDPLRLARRLEGLRAVQVAPAGTMWSRARDAVRTHPVIIAATVCMALAHAVMVSVMVMTPLHMEHGDASLEIIGVVIGIHVLGMFGFSPLIGWVADRWGCSSVMVLGGVILVASTVISGLAPHGTSWEITVGLFGLGIGWACATVAAAALLSGHTPVEVRTDVQGLADAAMGGAAALAGVFSGVIVQVSAFAVLNAFAASLAVVAIAAAWATRGTGPGTA